MVGWGGPKDPVEPEHGKTDDAQDTGTSGTTKGETFEGHDHDHHDEED